MNEIETEANQGLIGSQVRSLEKMSHFPKGSSPVLWTAWVTSFSCFSSVSNEPEAPQMTKEKPEEVSSHLQCNGEGNGDFDSHLTKQIFVFCLWGGNSPLSSPLLPYSPSHTQTEQMCRAKGKGSRILRTLHQGKGVRWVECSLPLAIMTKAMLTSRSGKLKSRGLCGQGHSQ